jgi:hypothetical protein
MHASGMNPLSILAVGGGGDLLVGILIGSCLGILIGPGFRAWQTHREWVDASREAGLAGQLLERMELDAELEGLMSPTEDDETAGAPAWRTHR